MGILSSRSKTILLFAALMITSVAGMQSAVSIASATPYTGSPPSPTNLTVYYHNLTTPDTIGSLQVLNIADTWNDTVPAYSNLGDNLSATHYLSLNFTMFPQLAGPLALNGTAYSWIYLSQNGSSPTSGHITLSVYEVSPAGTATLLGTGPATATTATYPGSGPTPVLLAGPTLSEIIPSNYSLSFEILVNGGTSQIYNAYWGHVKSTYYYSRATISASSYLEVGSMYAVNSTGQTVYTLSPTASNKTISIYANLSDPLGEYDFSSYPVSYSVENATGAVILSGSMSPVGVYSPYGYTMQYEFSMNYSSEPSGALTVTVNGTDNTMHNYLSSSGVLYGRNAFGTLPLYIGTPPVRVSFTVTDYAGNTLPGAKVSVSQFSYTAGYNSTGSNGVTTMLLSSGNYSVALYWQSVLVGTFPVHVNSTSSSFTLRAQVYSPILAFEDQSGTPLSFAQAAFISPSGSRLPLMSSSSNGTLSLNEMATGEYSATVFWHGSTVFNGSISVDSNGFVAVNVNAYMQDFKVVSSSGSPVATANVVVVNSTTGIYAAFNTTNATGFASSVLPYGVYNIVVYWKGITVYDAPAVVLNNPTASTMVLNASIYDVTVRAVTSGGSTLPDVVVSIYSPTTGAVLSAVTGTSGEATFTVAAGNYTLVSSFATTYDLSPVTQKITQSLNVSQSTSLTVKFTKVYPPVTSTNLFYVIVALVAVIAAAAVTVALVIRRSRSAAKQPGTKEKPGN